MRVKSSTKFLCVSLLFLLGIGIYAQNAGRAEVFPRLEPDPKAIEYARRGAQGGGYSWEDLAAISLWASGDAGVSNLDRIRTAVADLRSSPDLPAAARERAEYILAFMHKNFLKSYSLNQTRVDTLLSGGRYNCVSSAVLYTILCMSAGLDVSGVMTKDHAFATVRTGGESIDVETTNPYGFDPGSRREFHDQFGTLTGFAYVPARNYRDRETITSIELVSLILSNLISDLETRSRFAEAIPLAVDRAALLSGSVLAANSGATVNQNSADAAAPFFEEPRRDLMNRLFNYGAFLLKSGKEEECLRWAAFASPRYPEEARWQEFILAAANNRVQKFIKAGQNAGARTFLDSQKAALNAANYALLDAMLIDTELVNRAAKIRNVSEGDSIIAAIELARSGGRINAERASELLTFAVQKTAAVISAAPERNWLAAINYIENAIIRFGANRELDQALRNYRANRAADFHNRFAAAWNKRNFEEAERILNEGLAELPDNRQLLEDKKILKR